MRPEPRTPPLLPDLTSAKHVVPLSLGVVLVLLTIAAFIPALLADFVSFDDPKFVTENLRIRELSADNLWWMLTQNSGGHWHPLTWLSWAIDHVVWGGLKPFGFHLTNVLLHATGAVLVQRIGVRVMKLGWGDEARGSGVSAPRATAIEVASFFAAAVFAVHPLRVESVAWVTERRDVLSAVFLFGAVLAYLKSVRPRSVPIGSIAWTGVTCVLLGLSLLSKAWGMSFFVIALILDWYPLRRLPSGWRGWLSADVVRVAVQKTPFALLGIGAAVLAAWAQNAALATKTLEEWGVMERAVQSVYGLWFYIWKSVYPSGLCVLYELPDPLRPSEWRFVAAYFGVAIGSALIFVTMRRWPAIAAGACVYVVMLGPVLGLLQSGEQLVADRYSYLACVPLGMLVSAGALALSRRRSDVKPGLLVGIGAVVVCALGLLTFAQSGTWRNGLTLWSRAYEVSRTPAVRLNYGQELYEVGRKEEAARVLAALVNDVPGEGRAWFLLAEHFRELGDVTRAEEAYRRAAATMPQAYMAHVNLGGLLITQPGRTAEAIASFRAAVADIERGGRRNLHPGPYLALGDALRKTGDFEGARTWFTKALEFPETRANAERELRNLGK